MVSTLTILLVSVLSLFLAWKALRPSFPQVKTLEDWEAKKHEVDPAVFRLLLDPTEEQYLRRSFPPHQFRALQRQRIALALGAIQLVGDNAGMLMKLGQMAKSEANPALTKEAEDLINTALRVRVNLLVVQPCLYLKWLLPGWTGKFPAVEIPYEELLSYLSRVQQQHQWAPKQVVTAAQA
jgi:hypothetical protein